MDLHGALYGVRNLPASGAGTARPRLSVNRQLRRVRRRGQPAGRPARGEPGASSAIEVDAEVQLESIRGMLTVEKLEPSEAELPAGVGRRAEAQGSRKVEGMKRGDRKGPAKLAGPRGGARGGFDAA